MLLIIGNTGLIREFVLNELKDDHNLDIQRISLLQKRTAAYFKNSILEGTQSTVEAASANKILCAFFKKPPVAVVAEQKELQLSQKILLFEDIDQVFTDEGEFHSQLIKLLEVTKVPVIFTMRENKALKEYLKQKMVELGLAFDVVKYRYLKAAQDELRFILVIIHLLEGFVQTVMRSADESAWDISKELEEANRLCSQMVASEDDI